MLEKNDLTLSIVFWKNFLVLEMELLSTIFLFSSCNSEVEKQACFRLLILSSSLSLVNCPQKALPYIKEKNELRDHGFLLVRKRRTVFENIRLFISSKTFKIVVLI